MDSSGALCPSCGEVIPDNICPNCSFAFSETLACPQKNSEGICNKTEEKCNIESIGYENCDIFREVE